MLLVFPLVSILFHTQYSMTTIDSSKAVFFFGELCFYFYREIALQCISDFSTFYLLRLTWPHSNCCFFFSWIFFFFISFCSKIFIFLRCINILFVIILCGILFAVLFSEQIRIVHFFVSFFRFSLKKCQG